MENEKTEKRVIIAPELELVVMTDKGMIQDGVERVGIEGEFIIDAQSVALLITALTGKTIHRGRYSNGFLIMADDAAQKTLVEEMEMLKGQHNAEVNELKSKLAKAECGRDGARTEILNFHHRIRRFNETRHWWERKLIIDEK